MRKALLAVALACLVVVTTMGASPLDSGEVHGRFDQPQQGFAPAGTVLRVGAPAQVGLDPEPIDAAVRQLKTWTEPGGEHPMYAGGASVLVHDGVIVSKQAIGYELCYSGDGTQLPAEQQEQVQPDTIFDIASLTKLFTSIAVLQQVEDGRLELDTPVAKYLLEFGVNGKGSVTVRQLLTHTSGLQASVRLWELPKRQRIPHVMSLAPVNPPGSTYLYSDVNMIVLGELVERVTGAPLDVLVERRITDPLGMEDTGFTPPASKQDRIAATEYQTDPDRGMLRGQVHDENAWALGGVAGHAGIFSTVEDLAVLGQAILNGGVYAGERILRESSVEKILSNYNSEFPGDAHGLGFELNQRWYMAGLSGPRSAGHTGFTGTSMVIDPASRSIAILLTNRVHPSREWSSANPARVALAQGLARAMSVPPLHGESAWLTGAEREQNRATLTTDDALQAAPGTVRVSFDAFVDTESSDYLVVEYSDDGGRSWQPVRLSVTGRSGPDKPQFMLSGSGHRAWWNVTGTISVQPGAEVRFRWRYEPDGRYLGRGVFVDGVTVSDRSGMLFNGETQQDRLASRGWVATGR